MGGTSTDVALVLGGAPQWTTTSTIDGLPIGLPVYDIHTVGAGGGSIAYLDPGGALRVGPRSAGAVPGPACYEPRRHIADCHRRQPHPGPNRSRFVSRRCDAARCRAVSHGDHAARRGDAKIGDRSRPWRHPRRRSQHGRRRSRRHRAARPRSAAILASSASAAPADCTPARSRTLSKSPACSFRHTAACSARSA